jgi:hypothetical protein
MWLYSNEAKEYLVMAGGKERIREGSTVDKVENDETRNLRMGMGTGKGAQMNQKSHRLRWLLHF